MYISPGTYVGSRERFLSKIYIWVLMIGVPIVILSKTDSFFKEDHTVVSVGPYILNIDAVVKLCSFFSKEFGKGSPPINILLHCFIKFSTHYL